MWPGFTYFQHQIEGIEWMLEKEEVGTLVEDRTGGFVRVHGGFQCDDMGLGKTIQVASVIINNPCRRTLLIAPLAMIDTWADVLKRTGCAVYCLEKGSYKMEWTLMNDPDAPVVRRRFRPAVYISNYEKLYHTWSVFATEWDRVVLDEAHKIRNGDGEIARSCRKIVAPLRWVVTGTPLVNSLKDVVSLIAFIGVPYSKLWRWEPRYLNILPQILIHRSLDSLRSIIKGAPPVPEIIHMELPFTTEAEEEFYYGVQGATESMAKKYSSDILSGSQAFLLLLRLRQISVHPQVYINARRRGIGGRLYDRKDWKGASTKLQKIQEIIQGDVSLSPHKYIIFCQFYDEMSLIREYLVSEGIVPRENILSYSGNMTQDERADTLKRSKEISGTGVLLLQLQAGGVGLNLQEYDRIIFVSPWWTAALMDQAVARAVRMGQTKVVKVFHLHLAAESEGTLNIDALVNAKAEEKRKMLQKLFTICEARRHG